MCPVESTAAAHQKHSHLLVSEVMRRTAPAGGSAGRAAAGGATIRIGISGAPGVGKSTFIEAFGTWLIGEHRRRLAVLAVDPSSARTGGSILGDRTRMTELSRNPAAFIRSTPSRGVLGGVARNTMETMALCEAAGFELVLVETVGVGQSEYAVADIVDMFVLLASPGAGDELQGIKRGVMELADLVVVTKADGSLAKAANIAKAEYVSALQLIRPRTRSWRPRAMTVSSVDRTGFDALWQAVGEFVAIQQKDGEFAERRREQRRTAMWNVINESLARHIATHPEMVHQLAEYEARVLDGVMSPVRAASEIVEGILQRGPSRVAERSG